MAEVKETCDNITLVCPYCGHKESDPCEIFSDIEEDIENFECGHCGKLYTASRQVIFYYYGRL
jgi:transcription elongation factor Elf1